MWNKQVYDQRHCDMQPSRITYSRSFTFKFTFTYLQQVLSEFAPGIVIRSLNLWQSQLLVSCIMCWINLEFLQHSVWSET